MDSNLGINHRRRSQAAGTTIHVSEKVTFRRAITKTQKLVLRNSEIAEKGEHAQL